MIYILTRFNLGNKATGEWATERLGIMKKWLFPSVKAQTSNNYRFGLIVNHNTAPEMVAEIKAIIGDKGFILKDTREGRFKEKCTITEDCGWDKEFYEIAKNDNPVVTARVDSDDFLLPNFVGVIERCIGEATVRCVVEGPHLFINNDCGNYWINKQPVANGDVPVASSACTLIEFDTLDTVYYCSHTKLNKVYKMMLVEDIMWVRIMRGKRGVEDHIGTKLPDAILFNGKFKDFHEFMADEIINGILSGVISPYEPPF